MTRAQRNDLTDVGSTEARMVKLRSEVTKSLNPVKTFIDEHVDANLANDLKAISVSTEMPIYRQVQEMTKIIGSKCLGDAVTTREKLMAKFGMGRATSAAEFVTVLNNFSILLDLLIEHFETVTNTVDEAATIQARAIDDEADEVMQHCLEPPTREECVTFLERSLDTTIAAIAPIVMKLDELRSRPWADIVATLKPMAERMAGAAQAAQSNKRPRLDDGGKSGGSGSSGSSSSNSSSSSSSSSSSGNSGGSNSDSSGHGGTGGMHLVGAAGYQS